MQRANTPQSRKIAGVLASVVACLLLAVPTQAAANRDGSTGELPAAARAGDGKTVALTADLTIRTTTARQNGERDSAETKQHVYRDSQGRMRVEAETTVTISDPVARTNIQLDTRNKSYRQTQAKDEASAPTATKTKQRNLSSAPRLLGTKKMQGILVEGHAQAVTMPASNGLPARQREVTIWHSPALKLPVETRIVEASGAETLQTYSNIRVGEPAASLFSVPAGYHRADTVKPNAVPASDLHTVAILDGQVHHRIRFANGSWSDWGFLGNPGSASSVSASATPAGDLHVVVVSEGNVYHRIRFTNGSWSGWGLVETGSTVSSAAVSTTGGSDLHLVAVADNYPLHKIRFANGTWSTGVFLGFDVPVFGELTASTTPGGDLHVAASTDGGQVYHGIRFAAGNWSGFALVGNPGIASALSVSTLGGDLHTAAVLNGQVHHRIRSAGGGWTEWVYLGNPGTASAIGVSTEPSGDLHVAAVLNGQVHHRIRANVGSWTDWGFLGNPGTANDVAVATSTPPPDTTPCPINAPETVSLVSFGFFLGAAVAEATTDGAKGCRFLDSYGIAEPPLAGFPLTDLGRDYFQWYIYDDGGPVPFLPWIAYGVIEWVAGRDGVDPSYFQTLLVLVIYE
jgi:hypothetical protein